MYTASQLLDKINKYIDLAKKAMMVIIGVAGVILVLLSIKRIYRITFKKIKTAQN